MSDDVRKGQWSGWLDREAFRQRFRRRFFDPAFSGENDAIDRLEAIAWEGYRGSRKSPVTRRAGEGFADPEAKLSVEWLEARDAVMRAAAEHADASQPARALLVVGAARTDATCPGEVSKSWRIAGLVEETLRAGRVEVDRLDLSELVGEPGRTIHPCKGCVSTAMPLCHWPCSCYPNHALGQSNDWMNEIYPRWVRAHGIVIVTPVHWYQVPSVLKLMIDRLVCADGGNPDPTSTGGKDPAKAKALELAGWDYPRHLAGRAYGLVVHADASGAEDVRRALSDWLDSMGLVDAGPAARLDRYVGYYEPYATSHQALDRDEAFQEEARNVARALAQAIPDVRAGRLRQPDVKPPRDK